MFSMNACELLLNVASYDLTFVLDYHMLPIAFLCNILRVWDLETLRNENAKEN